MFYKEYGDKDRPMMVFLHGGGVSGWMWRKQIEHFSDYYCVVPDLPEHGRSHAEVFGMESCAEAVLELIDQLAGDQPVIVVGFSLGAQVVVEMLSRRSERIDYAMINSALVVPQLHMVKWLAPSIKLTFPLIQRRAFAKLQSKTLYVSAEDFEQYFEESKQITPEGLIRVLTENMSYRMPSSFAEASTRILVTVGEKEKGMMQQSARTLVASNRHSIGVVLQQIGHGISLAEPARFNHMLRAWIEEDQLPTDKVIRIANY